MAKICQSVRSKLNTMQSELDVRYSCTIWYFSVAAVCLYMRMFKPCTLKNALVPNC